MTTQELQPKWAQAYLYAVKRQPYTDQGMWVAKALAPLGANTAPNDHKCMLQFGARLLPPAASAERF